MIENFTGFQNILLFFKTYVCTVTISAKYTFQLMLSKGIYLYICIEEKEEKEICMCGPLVIRRPPGLLICLLIKSFQRGLLLRLSFFHVFQLNGFSEFEKIF